jgi:hypothetical protein
MRVGELLAQRPDAAAIVVGVLVRDEHHQREVTAELGKLARVPVEEQRAGRKLNGKAAVVDVRDAH